MSCVPLHLEKPANTKTRHQNPQSNFTCRFGGGNHLDRPMASISGFDDDDNIDDCTSGMLVAVRLRPLTGNEKLQGHRSCCRVVGDQVVVIEKFGVPNGHLKSQQSSTKEYAYDIAFPNDATQEDVYTKTVKDIVPTILNGYHATIFAYGATGAGKTHTMMGSERDGLGEFDDFLDEDDFQVDGIIPHALSDIFTIIRHRKEEEEVLNITHGSTFEWKVLVSYLEVYNEQIRDLLHPSSKALALREDQARGIVHVAGLHHEEAQSVGHVLQLLRRGNRHRKTEPTAANQVSSRSHAVIQVIVRHTTTTMLSEMNPRKSTVEGKLSLIDLAGSERASTTQNRGMRLTEGANINKSLLALANCINSLSSHNRRVRSASFDTSEATRRQSGTRAAVRAKVQYRDSKLTHLLKNSLEGECRLVMIANVNPSHACFDESHNTLKYANRAKNIKIRPKMHVMTAEMTYAQRIDKLEKENVQLRKALASAQAELQSGKRKSIHLDHEISPETLKRLKNLPLSGEQQPPRDGSNSEMEAMRETIRNLHQQKASLENSMAALNTENELLKTRLSLAQDCYDKMAPRELPAAGAHHVVMDPVNAIYAEPSPTFSSQSGRSLPKRVRVASPKKTRLSLMQPRHHTRTALPPPAPPPLSQAPPRPRVPAPRVTAVRQNKENRASISNLVVPPTFGGAAAGPVRRMSVFGTSESRTHPSVQAPTSSRLKKPLQYRKSIGGRV